MAGGGKTAAEVRKPMRIGTETLTPQEVAALSATMITQEEFGAIFGVTQQAVSVFLKKPVMRAAWDAGRAQTKKALRAKQVEKALEGNVVALIWAGKQYLDQSDARREEVTQNTNVKVEYVAVWGTPDGRLPEPGETELLEGEVEDEDEEDEE